MIGRAIQVVSALVFGIFVYGLCQGWSSGLSFDYNLRNNNTVVQALLLCLILFTLGEIASNIGKPGNSGKRGK